MLKVIFLDIDGVLNHSGTKAKFGGFLGVDKENLSRLKRIVDSTGAKIVLTSSWKTNWSPDRNECEDAGLYLNKRFAEAGLHISRKTQDNGYNRGEGITNWIKDTPAVTSWVVLDDDVFPDYAKHGIIPHLVHTSFSEGLTEDKANEAISILEKLQ